MDYCLDQQSHNQLLVKIANSILPVSVAKSFVAQKHYICYFVVTMMLIVREWLPKWWAIA